MVKAVSINGKEMEYIRFGKEDGEAFVILPGLSLKSVLGSADAIVSAYALIAKDHDIYLFDHVKGEPEGYGIEDMAEDTLEAFKKLGIDKAHIMGVSMGGMVAQEMALKSPESTASLILCSTASKADEEFRSVFKEWRELALKRDEKGLGEAFGRAVYTPSFFEEYRENILSACEGAGEREYEDFVTNIDAVLAFDLYEDIDRIKCRAFVIGAGEDRVLGTKASLDLMAKLGCEGYIYEGYGHGVYDEAADYLQRIKGFLER